MSLQPEAARCYHLFMALNPELKALLVCPKCKGELVFHEERGEIHCRTCRLIFAIQEDIPVLLLDEARPLPEAAR